MEDQQQQRIILPEPEDELVIIKDGLTICDKCHIQKTTFVTFGFRQLMCHDCALADHYCFWDYRCLCCDNHAVFKDYCLKCAPYDSYHDFEEYLTLAAVGL